MTSRSGRVLRRDEHFHAATGHDRGAILGQRVTRGLRQRRIGQRKQLQSAASSALRRHPAASATRPAACARAASSACNVPVCIR
jgi:hypothetical protein